MMVAVRDNRRLKAISKKNHGNDRTVDNTEKLETIEENLRS
jgi:hypothetical protein